MKKKVFIAGMLAVLLAFGLVITGCDNGTKSESWEAVTDFAQLDGTWKGSFSVTITLKEFWGNEYWASIDGDNKFGADAKVKMTSDIILDIDIAAETLGLSVKMTIAYSGKKVAAIWEAVIEEMEPEELEEANINEGKHSITMEIPAIPIPLSDEEIANMTAGGIEINQDGTKLKYSEEMSSEMAADMGNLPDGVEISPIVFIKQ